MTIETLTTLEDGAYRIARIGLRVLRQDGDPDRLPVDVYERLRRSVALLDPDALGRVEAAVLAVPEGELLDLLEDNLDADGSKVNTAAAASVLAARPEVIGAACGLQPAGIQEGAKLAALSLGLGASYLAVEQYLERVMSWGADLE